MFHKNMTAKKLKFLILFLILAFLSSNAFSDIIYLKNGRKVIGTITRETDTSITVKMEIGEVVLKKDEIHTIEKRKEKTGKSLLEKLRKKTESKPDSSKEKKKESSSKKDKEKPQDAEDLVEKAKGLVRKFTGPLSEDEDGSKKKDTSDKGNPLLDFWEKLKAKWNEIKNKGK